MASAIETAREVFRDHGGALRTSEALADGIHPRTLYAMRDAGEIEQLAWGLYRLVELPPLSEPDLATVGKRIPQGVVCLISALAYHELTTQVPHEVHLALPRTARRPRLAYPPLHVYRFSREAFEAGVETHTIDRMSVRIYDPAKTVADCFKYRNKVGLDVALEALRDCWHQRKASMDELWKYAKTCRVANVIRPYLESLT